MMTRIARAFRRTALPLASYYAVTLALPLANGAAHSGAFVEHALVVLVVPPILILLAYAAHTVSRVVGSLAGDGGVGRLLPSSLRSIHPHIW
jgi:hypothetical protein